MKDEDYLAFMRVYNEDVFGLLKQVRDKKLEPVDAYELLLDILKPLSVEFEEKIDNIWLDRLSKISNRKLQQNNQRILREIEELATYLRKEDIVGSTVGRAFDTVSLAEVIAIIKNEKGE